MFTVNFDSLCRRICGRQQRRWQRDVRSRQRTSGQGSLEGKTELVIFSKGSASQTSSLPRCFVLSSGGPHAVGQPPPMCQINPKKLSRKSMSQGNECQIRVYNVISPKLDGGIVLDLETPEDPANTLLLTCNRYNKWNKMFLSNAPMSVPGFSLQLQQPVIERVLTQMKGASSLDLW